MILTGIFSLSAYSCPFIFENRKLSLNVYHELNSRRETVTKIGIQQFFTLKEIEENFTENKGIIKFKFNFNSYTDDGELKNNFVKTLTKEEFKNSLNDDKKLDKYQVPTEMTSKLAFLSEGKSRIRNATFFEKFYYLNLQSKENNIVPANYERSVAIKLKGIGKYQDYFCEQRIFLPLFKENPQLFEDDWKLIQNHDNFTVIFEGHDRTINNIKVYINEKPSTTIKNKEKYFSIDDFIFKKPFSFKEYVR